MTLPYPPISSPLGGRPEELAQLVYELLDAHSDTQRLVHEQSNELQWRLHLDYLKDLQRLGREVLAREFREPPIIGQSAARFGGRPRP